MLVPHRTCIILYLLHNQIMIHSQVFMAYEDGKGLFYSTDSFNNHLLHIACKNGNSKALKVTITN